MLFGGQTGAILFAFIYRAKKLSKQHPTGFEYWGCANRIVNGRAVCDSHHVNEDTLQNTYTAAIRDMIEDAEEIMTAVKESAGLVMEPENRAAQS